MKVEELGIYYPAVLAKTAKVRKEEAARYNKRARRDSRNALKKKGLCALAVVAGARPVRNGNGGSPKFRLGEAYRSGSGQGQRAVGRRVLPGPGVYRKFPTCYLRRACARLSHWYTCTRGSIFDLKHWFTWHLPAMTPGMALAVRCIAGTALCPYKAIVALCVQHPRRVHYHYTAPAHQYRV